MKTRKYHINLTINDERKTLTVWNVRQEYGVSVQDFVDVEIYLKDRKMTARGDTLEIALQNLADAIEYRVEMEKQCELMRKQFQECIGSFTAQFKTPIIGGVNG